MFDVEAAVYKNLSGLVEKLPDFSVRFLIRFLKKIFHAETFNRIYQNNHYLSGLAFVDSMLENLNITYTVKPNELENIPSTGGLIVIANHITGASDALSLVQLISNKRENKKVKILANKVLSGIEQAAPIMIPVDNISGVLSKKSFKALNESLENNEVIIIFPSGMVSRWSLKGIKDNPWKGSFFRLAQKTQTSILPIKVETRNSYLFYILSVLIPTKFTAFLLPREFALTSTRKPLHLTIGKVIPFSSFSDKKINKKTYIKMFYEHLYALGTKKKQIFNTEITIGSEINRKQLKQEVTQAQFLGYSNNGKMIILAEAEKSPFLLSELGRAREMSFRAVGGGTKKSRDNDSFDNHYKHLILWDEHDLEIVGAYRIGECKDIIKDKGKEGLYTSNLCNFTDDFKDYCHNSVELGRGFVQPKYWGTRSFDSLWQAVTVYLAHNPHIQYTYGAVTINANTPPKAVAVLVYFYTYHFSCPTKMMQAKKPYIMDKADEEEFKVLFDHLSYKEGFVVLKQYLKKMGIAVPTLLKQYIELYQEGAVRYFDFSVNDAFSDAVEGFIISDNYRMKKSIQERNLKNFYKDKTIDVLTSLYSSAYFNEMVNSITKHQRKSDINFVLVIIKVDEIEKVTDKILMKIATTLKKSLRDNDIIAKWDEDEFIFILKNVNYDETMNILSKLKDAITTASCSFGATSYQAPEDIGETFIRAKDALSEALECKDRQIVIQQTKTKDLMY